MAEKEARDPFDRVGAVCRNRASISALLLLLACCGEASSSAAPDASNDAPFEADGTGGNGSASATDAGDAAETDGTSGTGGSAEDASGDGWPLGDPGWQPVPWATTCEMFFATEPKNAVPQLEWTDCGEGCSRLVPNWPNMSGIPLQAAQVYKSGGTLRLGLHLWYGELGAWRKAIYDETMMPVVAWRGDATRCGANLLQWTATHVCLAMGRGADPTLQVFLAPDDPSGEPIQLFASEILVPLSCNENLFIASSTGGIPYLRDLDTGLERWIQFSDASTFDAVPVGANAFFVHRGVEQSKVKLTGWVWKRPDSLEQLVDAGDEMVYDIRSDGETLVWVQTTSTSIWDPAPGTLWTSPHTTNANEVVPTQRRPVPSTHLAVAGQAANEGYYALIEVTAGGNNAERRTHIYRLTDAAHWQLPEIEDVLPAEVIYLDSEEVWYLGTTLNGARSTIIRQKLDALGPGD